MKKLIIFVLLAALVIILLCACGTHEVIDRKPVDVRHTEAFSQVETDYVYKYNMLKGEFQLVPDIRTVYYAEKWEIRWLTIYSNQSEDMEWVKCSEEEYLAAKEYLNKG